MDLKKEFYKLKTPWDLLDFMKKNKNLEYDKDMAEYFNKICKKFSTGETPSNHSDPREVFNKK